MFQSCRLIQGCYGRCSKHLTLICWYTWDGLFFHNFFEGKRRYNIKLWKTFTDCFNCLPVAAILDEKIFCCHGGKTLTKSFKPKAHTLVKIALLVCLKNSPNWKLTGILIQCALYSVKCDFRIRVDLIRRFVAWFAVNGANSSNYATYGCSWPR